MTLSIGIQQPVRAALRSLLPILVLASPAAAQEDFFALDDVAKADEEPALQSFIDFGAGFLDDDSFAFGRYSGLTGEGLVPQLDFRWQYRPPWDGEETGYWLVEGRRLGQDNRRIDAEIGRQGSQRLSLSYREIPNHRYDDGLTPFRRDGSGVLVLPTEWSAGTGTGQMPLLEASLRDQNIDHERWRLDLSYSRLFGGGWQFDVDYRREVKDGSRLVGGVIGNSGANRRSALLAAPVDFVTDIVDASLHYSSDGYQAGLGVQASRFNNRQTSVTWQNPFGAVGGWADGAGFPDGLGRTSLEPDNDFVQARAFGAYNLSPTTRLSATVAAGRMSQNDALLPYTVNPALDAPLALPRTDLDGRIDTLLADVRLSARPLPRLSVSASYRYDDRDNQTPRDLYAPVRGDSLDQVAPESGRLNLPYSYTEQRFGVDARYRLASRTRLNAAYTRTRKTRDFMEVRRMDEDTLRVGFSWQPLAGASLGLDYVRSDRDGSSYDGNAPFLAGHVAGTVDPDDPLDFENHPLLRKYFLADRVRNEARIRADLYPSPVLGFGVQIKLSRDDYDGDFFGLTDTEVQSYSADATWTPLAGVALSWFYSQERFDSEQPGRNFRGGANKGPDAANPERDWQVGTDDRTDTAGFTVSWQDVGDSLNMGALRDLSIGLDWIWSRTRSKIDVESGAAIDTAPLPDLSTRLIGFGMHGDYRLRENTTLRLRFEHERYHSRDFALDGVSPDGVDAAGRVLGFGVASPRYRANWVTVSVRHRL